MRGARRVVAVAALLVVCCRAASAQLPTVRDPGQGVVSLSSGSTAAAELSGITWTGSTNYLAVGDNGAQAIWTIIAGVSGVSGNHLRMAVPPEAPESLGSSKTVAEVPLTGLSYVATPRGSEVP